MFPVSIFHIRFANFVGPLKAIPLNEVRILSYYIVNLFLSQNIGYLSLVLFLNIQVLVGLIECLKPEIKDLMQNCNTVSE